MRGLRPVPLRARTALSSKQVSGLLRWRKFDVHTHQTFPEALLPALLPIVPGIRSAPVRAPVPIAGAENTVSTWRGEGAGWSQVRRSLCHFVAGQVRSSEPGLRTRRREAAARSPALHGAGRRGAGRRGAGRRGAGRRGAGRRGTVSPGGARSPDSSCPFLVFRHLHMDASLDINSTYEGVFIRVSKSSSSRRQHP